MYNLCVILIVSTILKQYQHVFNTYVTLIRLGGKNVKIDLSVNFFVYYFQIISYNVTAVYKKKRI